MKPRWQPPGANRCKAVKGEGFAPVALKGEG